MNIATDLGTWLGAFCTLAIFSILFKDNPAYRLVENVYVGAATGYAIVVGVDRLKATGLDPLAEGNFLILVPMIFGILLYTRYFPSVSYLARMPLALFTGVSAAVALRGSVETQIVAQITATVGNLKSINGIVIFLGTTLSLTYFFLTFRMKGTAGLAPKLGKYFMMAAFGAAFGNTVMGRISTAIGRFQYLLIQWLGIGA
ncbi:MAG: hypothetical protein ACOX5M_07190 [Bacillota bacterium]